MSNKTIIKVYNMLYKIKSSTNETVFFFDLIECVISMSKSQITLNFLNLMIAHNELSFFEFRFFFHDSIF